MRQGEIKAEEWRTTDFSISSWNSKILNAIFWFVDSNQFCLIFKCKVAKEARDILQGAHKGISILKSSKLRMLTLKFEQLTRRDDEQFMDFYAKLSNITNTTYALEKKYSESKVVRKLLCHYLINSILKWL